MAFNKVTAYGESENILESGIGLVTKTRQASKGMAATEDGREVIKAGTLFMDSEDEFIDVIPSDGDNPAQEGWYVLAGGEYVLSEDESVKDGTDYYEKGVKSGIAGVVLADYDMTDFDEYPVSIVVQGRVKADKVSAEALAKKSDFAKQGLYLV